MLPPDVKTGGDVPVGAALASRLAEAAWLIESWLLWRTADEDCEDCGLSSSKLLSQNGDDERGRSSDALGATLAP